MAEKKSSLTEKLKYESERSSTDDWKKVYLYREGTFFHAFNQSAYLLSQFIYTEEYRKSIDEKHGLQVQHLKSSNGADYLMAGFPCRSLSKYIGSLGTSIEGDLLIVNISSDTQYSTEEYQQLYEAFLSSIPAKELKLKKGASIEAVTLGQDLTGRTGVFEIIKRIMAFKLEESNPMDAMNFLAKLKTMVGELL